MAGKTFVGNNEDWWNANTRIWFEKGKTANYGSMYIGYDDLFPQGGMNEKGLVFDWLITEKVKSRRKSKKPQFEHIFEKEIMKTCQNVDEVYNFLKKYDLSSISKLMIFFVDKAGNYLVVESDTMIKGNKDTYLVSNFCPSRTPDLDEVELPFYQKGRKLISAKVDTSLSYLSSLSDSLHQEREDNAAGTLYTTIYDLNEGTINLFFYHDYNYSIKFKLKENLLKKDTVLAIPTMFPKNEKGQDQLMKFTKVKDFINLLKITDLAKDSVTLAAYIKNNRIEALLGFLEMDIFHVGFDYLTKKRINYAINVLKINEKFSPHRWYNYNGLGTAYLLNKEYELALMYYTKSLQYNPENKYGIKQIKKINRKLRN